MILTFLIDPQQAAPDSTESALLHFPLSPFCAQISIQDTDTRFQTLIPAIRSILLNYFMKIRQDLLLDFRENIPHIISRFLR